MQIRVSVLIPVFNGENFVGKAIASALGQTVRDIEVVVADNGSTDATWTVVMAFAFADSRVRPLRALAGQGAAFARNACLEAARGEWIAVLDADDFMLPTRLERLLAFAEQRSAHIVADNQRWFDADGRFLRLAWCPADIPPAVDAAHFVLANLDSRRRAILSYAKPMLRRSLVDAAGLRYDPTLRVGEDYQFLFLLLKAGNILHLLADEALYGYVLTSGSLSRTLLRTDILAWRRVNRHQLASPGIAEPLRVALLEQRYWLGIQIAQRVFVDTLKAGRFRRTLVIVLRRPQAVPFILHFGIEALVKRIKRLRTWWPLTGGSSTARSNLPVPPASAAVADSDRVMIPR